jgi:phenylacetate-CoA ligase
MSFINLYRNLRKARKNLRLQPTELMAMQTKQFKAIVNYAYNNVPFYHQKFDSINLKPSDIETLDDAKKIPITTKSELQAHTIDEVIAKNVDLSKCEKNSTSGSTGIPLAIYFGKKTLAIDHSMWRRAFFNNGMRLRDRRISITDSRHIPKGISLTQRLGILKRKYIQILDSPEYQYNFIKKDHPDIVEGYPSSMAILANFCKDRHYELNFRMAMTNSESLDKKSRDLITSTFNTELFDYYGCTELSLMAWECRAHTYYHMNADSLLMEFVRDGESVSSGERGEIVCTSLINHEMPFIRYRIGDVGIPTDEKCSCGITLPCMKMVEGRCDDFLVTENGDVISPIFIFPYPFENIENIRQFRIIQENKNKLIIQLSLKKDLLANPDLKKAEIEIHRVFGKNVDVEFQIKDNLERDPNNKFRKVISHVPVKIG